MCREINLEKQEQKYVSSSVKTSELKALCLDEIDGKRPDIEKALLIFRERIEERYLHPIEKLNEDPFNDGFASMAISCLLVETFYQFECGMTGSYKNRESYTDFLLSKLGDIFDTKEKAERFYSDIRCGILHSAQTKNGSYLSCDSKDIVSAINTEKDSPIRVNIVRLSNRLKRYFDEYCDRVINDNVTQSNFVKRLRRCFKLSKKERGA